jgi:hypothetical protein
MRRRIIMKADAGSRRRLKHLQDNNSVKGTDNGSSQAVQSQRL